MNKKKSPLSRIVKAVKRLSRLPLTEPQHRKDGLVLKKRKKAR